MSDSQTSDSQIIDDLGGTAKVATLCKVSMAAVSQWREDGIPKARRMFLELARPEVFAARVAQALPAPAAAQVTPP